MSVVFDTSRFIPFQREELRIKIDKMLDDFMEPLMNSTIVAEIKRLADGANLPKAFSDGVKFKRTGPNQGEIINTWGTNEKPLAAWFNYGTNQHWIEPFDPDGALVFPDTSGRNSGQGEAFSKGHYVAGIPRTEVMESGFQIGKKLLAIEASKIVQELIRRE